jgi:hypothetical protein
MSPFRDIQIVLVTGKKQCPDVGRVTQRIGAGHEFRVFRRVKVDSALEHQHAPRMVLAARRSTCPPPAAADCRRRAV